ncbi:MAG: AAA family ATPase [Candidatus Eisenbacteria bacterium]
MDQEPGIGTEEETAEPMSVLSRISVDLGEQLYQRRFGSIVPWKSEVIRLLETLQKRSNHNVLLHGPVGVGKRTMVLRLAERIASGRISPQLRNKHIFEITLPSVLPYIQDADDFETVLFHAIKEAVEREDVILYFNQLENFLGSNGGAGASALLDVATRQLNLHVIASMSDWGYQKALFEHPWIRDNMVAIAIAEPSRDMSRKILRVTRAKLESFHNIEITKDAVDKAIDLSSYYLRSRVLPGKALEILDQACASAVVRGEATKKKTPVVDADAVGDAVSQRLGIPVEKLHDRAGGHLLRLQENLGACIKGQDEVLRKVSDVIRVAKLDLSASPDRPDGSFLFVGPSGVGKNQLARRLAVELYGSVDHLLYLDMAQYTGEDAARKLLGARGLPGAKGVLAGLIERNPNAVFLIDGIEKAHPTVGPILLQVLKEGQIVDEEGRRLSFSAATVVVIANSDNIFSEDEEKGRKVGFLEAADPGRRIEVQRKAMEQATKDFFAVDFLNSFDEVLFFDPLTPETVKEIAEIQIEGIRARLEHRGIALAVPREVTALVAEKGFSSETGAHKLTRTVASLVLQPVSSFLLEFPDAKKVYLSVEGEEVSASAQQQKQKKKK